MGQKKAGRNRDSSEKSSDHVFWKVKSAKKGPIYWILRRKRLPSLDFSEK